MWCFEELCGWEGDDSEEEDEVEEGERGPEVWYTCGFEGLRRGRLEEDEEEEEVDEEECRELPPLRRC